MRERGAERRPAVGTGFLRAETIIVALAALLFVPFAVAGPGFYLDDWYALRGARIDGWWTAAGDSQWRARPGAGAVYAVSFGLIHDHPAVHFALAAVLIATAARLLLVILRRFLPESVALTVAVVWLLVPNHTSLEMWPSALNIALALTLCLEGIRRLVKDEVLSRRDVLLSLAAMTIAVLTYEAVAPVAAVAVAVRIGADLRRGARPAAVRLGASAAIALGGAAVWLVSNWHPAKQGVGAWIDVHEIVPGHLGRSVFGHSPLGGLVTLAVLSILVMSLGYRLLRGRWIDEHQPLLLGAGVAVLVLGILPFARYYYFPLGLGDRVTVVSGIGGAMVLVAAARAAVLFGRWVGWLAVALGAVTVLSFRADMVGSYAKAADDGREVLAAVEARYPEPPEVPLVFGPTPQFENSVGAFFNVNWALQWLYGTYELEAITTTDLADFREYPPDRRFDLRSPFGSG